MANLISLEVNDLLNLRYEWDEDKYVFKDAKTIVDWKEDETYLIIFNMQSQEEAYKYFKANCGGFDILYESKPALNLVHPGENRNVLIVFEVQRRFFASPAVTE